MHTNHLILHPATRLFPMRSRPPGPARPARWGAALLRAGLLIGACSDDGADNASPGDSTNAPASTVGTSEATARATAATGDDPESEYCVTAREWAIHEMMPFDESDPEVLRTYIGEYDDFNHTARSQAPPSIEDDWVVSSQSFDASVVPVLDKYGYDISRIMAEATPEEQAVSEPPPDVAEAQKRILAYEAEVCGAQQPAAADATFEGPASEEYCTATAAEDERIGDAMQAEDSPAAVEALVTSGELDALMEATTAAAPEEISADVIAVMAYEQGPKHDVLELFGFDVRLAILEGTPEQRATIQSTDPSISEHFARVLAYEEQLSAPTG